mgnify:FL=1
MSKNTDLWEAQYVLIQGWVSPIQISESMKVIEKKPDLTLDEVLFQKGYIKKEQFENLQNTRKEKKKIENEKNKNEELKQNKQAEESNKTTEKVIKDKDFTINSAEKSNELKQVEKLL